MNSFHMESIWKFHGIHLEILQSIPPSMDSTWNNLGRVKYWYFLSPFHLVYYCTISFNLDKGVTCDTLLKILVSATFQKDGDRVIPPPAWHQSGPSIAIFSIGTCLCFQTRAMWHKTCVTFQTIWRGLWHVTSKLNEMVQYTPLHSLASLAT